MDNPSYMYNFFYSYSYIKLSIHFYWISDNNVKYINFKYIIFSSNNFGQDPSLVYLYNSSMKVKFSGGSWPKLLGEPK